MQSFEKRCVPPVVRVAENQTVRGRFAPSPSGRMHLGNLCCALAAWLSVRSQNGVMLLRIEDLDPDRCKPAYAEQLMDDLRWLGLDWDEGPGAGGCGPYFQSAPRTIRGSAANASRAGQSLPLLLHARAACRLRPARRRRRIPLPGHLPRPHRRGNRRKKQNARAGPAVLRAGGRSAVRRSLSRPAGARRAGRVRRFSRAPQRRRSTRTSSPSP